MAYRITGTINELLLKVLSGANYASQIARETQKSVPVVYRQLEALVKQGLLSKHRNGKLVEYFISWNAFAQQATRAMLPEFKTLTGTQVPDQRLETALHTFFASTPTIILLKKFFSKIGNNTFVEFQQLTFQRLLSLFLDAIGSMTPAQIQKNYADADKETLQFLTVCRERLHEKMLADPRQGLFK